ncbi:adult cuticle protein 1-like [Malaya genurostris]|uniref:adult cuticle protein 1-like n=1 Tax=Malaya genurostris TaxID=325434 RepID=UPI0026F3E3F6|nr:adult cuticle protein 1-like [Malaya genurostris]
MKCIAAVVMMALAVVVAEASYAPAVYANHYGYAAAPIVTYAAHNTWDSAPVPVAYNSWNAVPYNGWNSHYAPAAVAYHGAVVAPVPYSASYVAANRGAVHKAPLPGHIINQKSLNLAPAPGTW